MGSEVTGLLKAHMAFIYHFAQVSVQMLPAENVLPWHPISNVPLLPIIFNALLCFVSNTYPYLTAHYLYFFWGLFLSPTFYWGQDTVQNHILCTNTGPWWAFLNVCEWRSGYQCMFLPLWHHPWLQNRTWGRNYGENGYNNEGKRWPTTRKQVWGLERKKSQNPMGLNKVGAGGQTGRHLDCRIFNLFDVSASASRKAENLTWVSEKRDFKTTLQDLFPMSNDHCDKKSIFRMDINISYCNIFPFSPRNVPRNWNINKGVKYYGTLTFSQFQ